MPVTQKPLPLLPLLTLAAVAALAAAAPTLAEAGADRWPSFRGERARGVADGQQLPVGWNVASGENVRWQTEIPGLSHASPIVWDERLFVVTAVTGGPSQLVLGDRGGIGLARDDTPHSWRLLALDAASGEVIWQRDPYSGKPRAARHVKASQANATPATDGETVVALFGSQGLVAFDFAGEERWRVDLGVLDPGLYGDPTSHWGHASSPVIDDGRVFVQVDRHRDSFLAAYELATGKLLWKVARDEKPVWATPTVHVGAQGAELIVIGGDYDRGYDPESGEELWRFARDYEVKTPTPFAAGDLVILAGGYRGNPIYALKTGGRGDLSPAANGKGGEHLAWTSDPGGPYTSTPVAYREHLYFVRDTGIFTVLKLANGELVYRQRLASTHSASPVASDGKIYLTGEDGVVRVIAAGDELLLLGENDMGEPCMATPAIAGGTLFLRCRSHLWALAERAGRQPPTAGETKPQATVPQTVSCPPIGVGPLHRRETARGRRVDTSKVIALSLAHACRSRTRRPA